jgi:hypothetical protein
VRADAIGLLRTHKDAPPQVAETLARVAERDRSPGIRRLAREALAGQATR